MQPKIHPSNADVKHSHTIEDHAAAISGEYEHQEYPKVIGRDEDGREVVADSAEHEAMLLAENEEAGEGEDPEVAEEDGEAEAEQ